MVAAVVFIIEWRPTARVNAVYNLTPLGPSKCHLLNIYIFLYKYVIYKFIFLGLHKLFRVGSVSKSCRVNDKNDVEIREKKEMCSKVCLPFESCTF